MRFIEKITYLLLVSLFAAGTATATTTNIGDDSVTVASPAKRTKIQLADSASRVIRVPNEGRASIVASTNTCSFLRGR